jgi:hypothetical protein
MSSRPATLTDCPGCGAPYRGRTLRVPPLPVVSNYLFASPIEARRVPRRPILLKQCQRCALVHNTAFDPDAVPYDIRYENSQDISDVFRSHYERIAAVIAAALPRKGGRLLEVGCGKGSFLKFLALRCDATGDGYDTSYEGPKRWRSRVTFHRSYVHAGNIRTPYDAIICRHVVEHVSPIGEFLGSLAEIARASGDPDIFIETPRLEWILKEGNPWDVFYEHCNYFTESALVTNCRLAGLKLVKLHRVFGGQYQLLHLRIASKPAPRHRKSGAIPREMAKLSLIEKSVLGRLRGQIAKHAGTGKWALWGAGAKGVSLANRLDRNRLHCVFDINPAKQKSFVAGSAVPVLAPSADRLREVALVIICNPAYQSEISKILKSFSFKGRVLVAGKKPA